MKRSRLLIWSLVGAAWAGAPSFAGDEPAWVVSSAEGAAEIGRGGAPLELADTGADVAPTDRVVLGFGAKLSIVAVEGAAKGSVVTVHGPAEGSLAELVAGATESAKAANDVV